MCFEKDVKAKFGKKRGIADLKSVEKTFYEKNLLLILIYNIL
jgi:hypothetical protein